MINIETSYSNTSPKENSLESERDFKDFLAENENLDNPVDRVANVRVGDRIDVWTEDFYSWGDLNPGAEQTRVVTSAVETTINGKPASEYPEITTVRVIGIDSNRKWIRVEGNGIQKKIDITLFANHEATIRNQLKLNTKTFTGNVDFSGWRLGHTHMTPKPGDTIYWL